MRVRSGKRGNVLPCAIPSGFAHPPLPKFNKLRAWNEMS